MHWSSLRGLEFVWLKNIDFFPPPEAGTHWERASTLCIGTKSRNMGDALALTPLPSRLKLRFPDLKITTYPRAFNPYVFENNPYISGIQRLPSRVYGDDAIWGSGQAIQLKEQFFGLAPSESPRPEIHLSEKERQEAAELIQSKAIREEEGKPLCLVHPWGTTHQAILPVVEWDKIIARWSHTFRFWQVGLQGHSAIKGCEYYLLLPSAARNCRMLFAIMSHADLFMGLDSGPMHVARAFDVPSLVFIRANDPDALFELRARQPYFLHKMWKYSQLYAENSHVGIQEEFPPSGALSVGHARQIDLFFEKYGNQEGKSPRASTPHPASP